MPRRHGRTALRRQPRQLRRRTRPTTGTRAPRPAHVGDDQWAVVEAEAQGDAALALEMLELADRELDPLHHSDLRMMATAGDDAPPWLVDRWIARQAHRWVKLVQGERWSRAADMGLAATWWWGSNACVENLPKHCLPYLGDDWVTREMAAHQLGGLRHFLRRVATPELRRRSGTVSHWSRWLVASYRLGECRDGLVEVEHLRSGRTFPVVDRGVMETYASGATVVGRVVDSEPEAMFETLPLLVDEQTAADVASTKPPSRLDPVPWAPMLSRAVDAGRLPRRVGMGWLVPVDRDVPHVVVPDEPWEPPPDPRVEAFVTAGLDRDAAGWASILEYALPLAACDDGAVQATADALHHLMKKPDLLDAVVTMLSGPEAAAGWDAMAACTAGPERELMRGFAARARAA